MPGAFATAGQVNTYYWQSDPEVCFDDDELDDITIDGQTSQHTNIRGEVNEAIDRYQTAKNFVVKNNNTYSPFFFIMISELSLLLLVLTAAYAQETTDDEICGRGTILVDGKCEPDYSTENIKSVGDCAIATASYGSELSPQVQMLREIRDNTLLNTESGKTFMNAFNTVYYLFSPQVAQLEDENPIFKEIVKLFITPMIAALSIMTLADGTEFEVVFFGVSTIGVIVGMYVIAPGMIIYKIKK